MKKQKLLKREEFEANGIVLVKDTKK